MRLSILLILLFCTTHSFAEKLKTNEAVDTYRQALEMLNEENFDVALPLLTKVISLSPNNSDLMHLALSHRGTCYYKLNQFFLAINDFNAALFVNVTEVFYHKPETLEFLTNYLNGINIFLSGSAKKETGSLRNACIDWRRAERMGESRASEMIRQYCN